MAGEERLPPGWEGIRDKTAAEFQLDDERRFESAVVCKILDDCGFVADARRLRRSLGQVTFEDLMDNFPDFPYYLRSRFYRRLPEQLSIAALAERFDKTQVFRDYRKVLGDAYLDDISAAGLVLFWPHLRTGRTYAGGAMVLHNQAVIDSDTPGFYAVIPASKETGPAVLETLSRFLQRLRLLGHFVNE